MNKIKLKVTDEIIVDDVFLNHGFALRKIDTKEQHEKIKKLGIVSSPENSCRIWEKDDKQYIFNGWEYDVYDRIAKYPKFIEIVEI